MLRLFSRKHYSFGQVLYTRSLMQDARDADIVLFQMEMRTRLKPRANYIRAMDFFPSDYQL